MSESFGGCCCERVRYRIAGPVVDVVACHCSLCRGATGAPLTCYAVVLAKAFSLVRGDEFLASYHATEKTSRHFCLSCGTPIFNSNPVAYPTLAMLYLGTLEGHRRLTPRVDAYCESKLDWVALVDGSRRDMSASSLHREADDRTDALRAPLPFSLAAEIAELRAGLASGLDAQLDADLKADRPAIVSIGSGGGLPSGGITDLSALRPPASGV